MSKPKSLFVKIDDPKIIQAFKDLAEARNIREENESVKIEWTAEKVAFEWLNKVATAVNRSDNFEAEHLRGYPTYDWADVDALREKRKLAASEKETK